MNFFSWSIGRGSNPSHLIPDGTMVLVTMVPVPKAGFHQPSLPTATPLSVVIGLSPTRFYRPVLEVDLAWNSEPCSPVRRMP